MSVSFDENPVGRIPSPSTVTWWLLPDVLVRVIRHSRRSLWRGCGCIRSSLAAVPTCSASRSVQRLPVGDSIAPTVARRCSQHSRQGDSPSWRTTGSALASPCLPSLRFCRPPERGAVLQRVPHGLLQCEEPSLHRAHPRLLQEGTARSAVPPARARGVWRCRPCRCAAAMVR